MILKGNSRANGTELAIHLTKTDNEIVVLHQLRGFASDDLKGAFQEIHAISRATRCKKYLYSLSLNPPANENASTEEFEDAIERAEKQLGLLGQPRAIVFHIKHSRRHCHVVWSRIARDGSKAIKLNYPKRKLNGLAMELFLQHGWELPAGFLHGQEADPMNYTYQEYQEAQRGNREAKHLKQQIKHCWPASDGLKSFERALERNGLFLAQGDRRGFVCVDYNGNTYSLSRWSGVKTKELSAQLGEPETLPCVDEVKHDIAQRMTPKIREYIEEATFDAKQNLESLEDQRQRMISRHSIEHEMTKESHEERWASESANRAARFATGFKGIWQRITGKHKAIALENEADASRAVERDKVHIQEMQDRHRAEMNKLNETIDTMRSEAKDAMRELHEKLADYKIMQSNSDLSPFRRQMQTSDKHDRKATQSIPYDFEQ